MGQGKNDSKKGISRLHFAYQSPWLSSYLLSPSAPEISLAPSKTQSCSSLELFKRKKGFLPSRASILGLLHDSFVFQAAPPPPFFPQIDLTS